MKKMNVKMHPAGVIALAAAFLFMDSHLVLSSALALLIHESAHLVVMRCCGMKNCSIELTPFGGMVDIQDFDSGTPVKRALTAIAGIVISAASALICWKWGPRSTFWFSFFQSNLSLAFVNSLPAWPLDGARFLCAISSFVGWEKYLKRVMCWITLAIGIGCIAIALFGVWHGMINPSLLLIGPYLCYAAQTEKLSSKVRKMQNTSEKLALQKYMPVSVWASSGEQDQNQLAAFLGRANAGSYQVLMQIDQADGRITRCWTENEIFDRLISDGKN